MNIQLPDDVRKWLLGVFGGLNDRVSGKLTRIPTTQEVSLDLTFIEHMSQVSAPIRFPSNWLLWIETHYLGGLRHFVNRWEVADIGVLVTYRHAGRLIRSKVALLQSKRLYSKEQHIDEDVPSMYQVGFGRLHQDDGAVQQLTTPRRFRVDLDSQYRALLIGDNQYKAIADYEAEKKIPIHYMLYNPLRLPFSCVLPAASGTMQSSECKVGTRIMPAAALRSMLLKKPQGYQPAYRDLRSGKFVSGRDAAGWRLEHFMVELLLGCHEGYIAAGRDDVGLQEVFFRRTGPIAAAISINIDSPVGFG